AEQPSEENLRKAGQARIEQLTSLVKAVDETDDSPLTKRLEQIRGYYAQFPYKQYAEALQAMPAIRAAANALADELKAGNEAGAKALLTPRTMRGVDKNGLSETLFGSKDLRIEKV